MVESNPIRYNLIALTVSIETVIHDLKTTGYINRTRNEDISRTILNLIILDRLNKLEDRESFKQLRLNAEVPLTVNGTDNRGQPLTIRGRADWALGWGRTKPETESLLFVLEAKCEAEAPMGMAQLIVYLAAIHAARKDKTNRTVFGMLSDARTFEFACLDNEKNLTTTKTLTWRDEKHVILSYLDTILLDAIESSPHTTPTRRQNTNLYNYTNYLRNSWRFGEEEEEEEEDFEDESYIVDVLQSGNGLVLRPARR